MRATTYRHSGLHVLSAMALPLDKAPDDRPPDVYVRLGPSAPVPHDPPLGEILLSFEHKGSLWYAAVRDDHGYLLRFCGRCEFRFSHDLTQVECRADPRGEQGLAPILFSGTAFSFLLAMRGYHVLHAGAVTLDGGAVALVGRSGQGKSTVTALLCARGASLVSDDVLRVDVDETVVCHRGGSEVRLRASAKELATTLASSAIRSYTTADDRTALQPPASGAVLPLRALVIPWPSRDTETTQLVPIARTDALMRLLSYPRVLGWQDEDVITRQFEVTSQLVARLPVYRAEIPWGPPFDPGAIDELLLRLCQVVGAQ